MTENTNPAESTERPVAPSPEAPKDVPPSAQAAPVAEPPAPAMEEGFFAESNRIIRETVERDVLNGRDMPFIRNFLVYSTMALYYVELPIWVTSFLLFKSGNERMAKFADGLRLFFIQVFLFTNPLNWPCLCVGAAKSGALERWAAENGSVFVAFLSVAGGGGCAFFLVGIPLMLLSLLVAIVFNTVMKIPPVSRLMAMIVGPFKRHVVDRIPERVFVLKKCAKMAREMQQKGGNYSATQVFLTLAGLTGIVVMIFGCLLLFMLYCVIEGLDRGFDAKLPVLGWVFFLLPYVVGFGISALMFFVHAHFLRFGTFDWKDKNAVANGTSMFLSMLVWVLACIACIATPFVIFED